MKSKKGEVTLKLSASEFKLLTLMLKDLEEDRSDMSCNDPYTKEEKLFSKSQRNEMLGFLAEKSLLNKEDVEEMDGYMPNYFYVAYMISKLKDQAKNGKEETKS